VISAAAVSFAHGANDVSNAIGPFAAIVSIYKTGAISDKNPVEVWMLGGIGSTGIVAGLATYGWKIMRVLGVKMTCITPCRGFTMETTTALVTAFGSYLGLPLSTTQTHVGSTTGVGLAENRAGSVKWPLLFKMFAGWVATLVLGAAMSAALFAQGIYSPSLGGAQTSNAFQKGIASDANATLASLQTAFPDDPRVAEQQLAFDTATNNTGKNAWPMSTTPASDVFGLASNVSALEASLMAGAPAGR